MSSACRAHPRINKKRLPFYGSLLRSDWYAMSDGFDVGSLETFRTLFDAEFNLLAFVQRSE